MDLEKKKKRELSYAEIFSRHIKVCRGLEYRAVLKENSEIEVPSSYVDVDVILEPLSIDRLPLFLQLTLDIRFESEHPGIKCFSGCEIDKSIKKKESKYLEQGRDVSNVVLLLQGDFPSDEASLSIDPRKYAKSGFRGIYYVSPKTKIIGESVDRTDGWDEFVVPIKECLIG